MPLELRQSPPIPQPVDQTQPGLEQAQHWSSQVVDQAVLAGADGIGSPQQQPGIDQGEPPTAAGPGGPDAASRSVPARSPGRHSYSP